MSASIVSPHDGSVYKEIPLQTTEQVLETVAGASGAQKLWQRTSLEKRMKIIEQFVNHLVADKEDIATELSLLIGRHLLSIAQSSLQDVVVEDTPEFSRFMTREPLGVVFIISAWNYPYLVSVNGIVPALLAGNAVILKYVGRS
ncbi:hypothetical protein HDU91_003719 [Kappamyces sp. JEL0680]|nr:hypothetical protein HDU91_003719 [Kappamyces sp. JEL0680]